MRRTLIPILFLAASISFGRIDYKPITGELLEHWNTVSRTVLPIVYHFDTGNLPNGIYELLITGIEVERDSLDIYLLGKTHDSDIPLLLGTSSYRGNYNFAKSDSRYFEEEDEIRLFFQMPYSASYHAVCYRWNIDSGSLECLRYYSGDPSMEALERADSLMAEGNIAEAIREINEMFYPGNYYNSDEMFVRLLRSVNRAAGEAGAAGNFGKAVSLFGDLAGFLHTDREWFTAFTDSLDYVDCDYSEYMDLGEYAMIMNNYAYYLEQTDDLDKSLIVLRKVLDLKPERMVAHLNIADVLWALGESTEARGHYIIYLEMMTDRELTRQIPAYVRERLTAESVSPVNPVTINILSEHLCPIETMRYNPILIDRCQFEGSGRDRVQLQRHLSRNMVSFCDELWTVETDSNGYPLSCEEIVSGNPLIMTTAALDGSRERSLIACSGQADTAWTCSLEGTDSECYWSSCVTELSGGGYMVSSSPDAFDYVTEIQRISANGETLFHYSITSSYLLDLSEGSGEIWPHIKSFRETSAGNIIVSGNVQEWVTDPDCYFVCFLDGETGNPLWKTAGAGLGEACVYDAIEISSGLIYAVGATAISIFPEGQYYTVWGRKQPFIAVFSETGVLQKMMVLDLDLTDLFSSIVEINSSENEFLIIGSDSLSDQMVLLRAIIPTDSESWERGPDTPVIVIDSAGDEYSKNEFGIYSRAVVTDPDGTACWSTGTTEATVAWEGFPGERVKCDVYRNDRFMGDFCGWVNNNDSEVRQACIPSRWGTGSGFRIRIVDDQGVLGWSEEFEIGSLPVTVDGKTIEWTGGSDSVKVELYDGVTSVSDLSGWIDNNGSFSLQNTSVPAEYNLGGSECRIRVTDAADHFGWADARGLTFGRTGPVSGMEFVTIPSGSFMMGEEEQRLVQIDSFELMTTEVTQGMWKEVMNENHNSGSNYGVGPLNPVHDVTWNECQNFVVAMNSMDQNSAYRLPTELEWEYACRAGTTTGYYWGDSFSERVVKLYCWHAGNSDNSTHPVGLLEPNAWGLYDILGNVSEWCEDVYTADLSDCPVDGSAFAGSSGNRVLRGGSFASEHPRFCSYRNVALLSGHYYNDGFRIARAVMRTPEEVVAFFVDMMLNSDGEFILGGLSEEELADFNAVLRVMKLAPDEMAAELSSGGIEITAEEIENMAIDEFVMVMLGSAEIEIGEAVINGETALVPVTFEGAIEEIRLVLVNGRWVIVDDGVDLF